MHTAAITYRGGRLEAREQDDVWIVRLAQLETRARYLDLALVELLGNASEGHRAAARLLSELAEVVEKQAGAHLLVPPPNRRPERRATRQQLWPKPLALGFRVLVGVVVAGAAFMLTTWLNSIR